MKKYLSFVLLISFLTIHSQSITVPANLREEHPRTLTAGNTKESIKELIKNEVWAKNLLDKLKNRVDIYANKCAIDPQWLVSRLQMYWSSHYTDVYVNSDVFAYAGGQKAPAPTVRFTGSRATTTVYGRPKLEDITPFMDDERGLLFVNNSKPNKPLEWAEPAKTGRNIESINREIMGIARDAAFLYWITDEQKYAVLAREVFDVYMTGIFYRNVPIDLNHGHQQTLIGMTSFEVIHEDILNELVPLYDFLYYDLKKNKADKMNTYASAFKKWGDNIIDNGVPHNNWDLFKSNYILQMALVLDADKSYADGKGRQYYIDYVLNKSSIRQWSLPKLIDYGFDMNTGIWSECPGYSVNVVADFANFVNWFDGQLNKDILPQLPIIAKAVAATPQYLFPNMRTVGFGDTHPEHLRPDIFARMVANAQRYGKMGQERQFTAMLKLFDSKYGTDAKTPQLRTEVSSFFEDKPLKLDSTIPAGKIEDYVSPTFWAPRVSWFVQRNGMDKQNSLMISMNGSEGNHMHANGISMELYGKGYTLAPDMGIGTGYLALDYAEFYSQFPAHNTVCVDGISSYPVMKSNHPFELKSCYPASGEKTGVYHGITFADVYFREPESCSDQTRMMSIVTTGEKTGYYVDIFRSHKAQGGDTMHDYFYHGLGQNMTITASNGDSLNLQPTQELAFAGGHLYGYSYLYNQKNIATDKDIKATFTMKMANSNDVSMNMWMKGEKDRTIFSALAPMCEGQSRIPDMPYNVKESPTLTFVARQNGEAWTHPFVSIFEPSTKNAESNIQSVTYFNDSKASKEFVGIKVISKTRRTDFIFSNSTTEEKNSYLDMTSQSTYSVIGHEKNGDCICFMGNGTELSGQNFKISTKEIGSVVIEKKNNEWFYTSNVAVKLKIGNKCFNLKASEYKMIKL